MISVFFKAKHGVFLYRIAAVIQLKNQYDKLLLL